MSYAVLTFLGVAAVVVLVLVTLSVNCTTPLTEVVPSAIEMSGVAPPDEAIGAVPVTLVTPPPPPPVTHCVL
jgi:hypothetical protein